MEAVEKVGHLSGIGVIPRRWLVVPVLLFFRTTKFVSLIVQTRNSCVWKGEKERVPFHNLGAVGVMYWCVSRLVMYEDEHLYCCCTCTGRPHQPAEPGPHDINCCYWTSIALAGCRMYILHLPCFLRQLAANACLSITEEILMAMRTWWCSRFNFARSPDWLYVCISTAASIIVLAWCFQSTWLISLSPCSLFIVHIYRVRMILVSTLCTR